MKTFKFFLILAVIFSMLCFSAFSAGTVYVDGVNGSDENAGTLSAPLATLTAALERLPDGGDIAVTGDITLDSDTELIGSNNCTVSCRSGATINVGEKLYINAPLTFKNVNFNFTANAPMIFCEGNSVTFGTGINNTYTQVPPIIHGGTYGGKSGMTYNKMCFSDYTLRIESGTWYYVKGGSFRDREEQPVGTLTNVTLEIAGGTFTSTRTLASDNALISPLGFDALLGDATLNITGGVFSSSIVGVARPGYNSTTSNNQYVKGNIYINVSGGIFNGGDIRAVQDSIASRIDGDFYVTVSGGTFNNFSGIDGSCVNGLAIADITNGVTYKNFDSLITLSNGGSATVTNGGVIRISGAVDSSSLKISGTKKVIIEGVTPDAAINLSADLYVGSNTEIDNVTLIGEARVISCADGRIYIGDNVNSSGVSIKNFTDATVLSGVYPYLKGARSKDVILRIDGATVEGDVIAVANHSTANGYVVLSSGSVGGNIYAFEYSGNKGAVCVLTDNFTGKVGVAKYPTEECVKQFGAVAPGSAKISYTGCAEYNAPTEAVFVTSELSLSPCQTEGDGSSPLTPLTDLSAAVTAADGKKQIVVCGPLHIPQTITLPKVSGKTVITSEYMGMDFRKISDAKIVLSNGLRMSGETVFEKVDFLAFEKYTFVSAEGNKLTVGDGVNCDFFKGKRVEKYPAIIGASHEKSTSTKSVDLTVASGTWEMLSGGSYHVSDGDTRNYTVSGNINVNIFGGRFTNGVYLTGRANVGGNASLNIYGGDFECPVYAAYDTDTTVIGDVTISINGGTFYGDICGGVGKTFTLNMASGNFDRVNTVDLCGGILNIGKDISLDAEITGVGQYQNPVANYADPSIVYHDGWYYYSFAKDYLSKPGLWMAKAANIYDIGNVKPTLIWAQALSDHETVVKSLWAPQLYFLDGSWYLYSTCDVGLESVLVNGKRMPVIWRGLTDNPIGEYEFLGVMENVDMEVAAYNSPRIVEHGGTLYMLNGSFFREEDHTNQHIQHAHISELESPTRAKGTAVKVSSPIYDYENNIMEGLFPLYSPNGTLYIIFAAGHTRSDEYCTGIMRFNGTENDKLTDASLWEKFPEPLQFASYENGVYSPGAMIVTQKPDGTGYLAAYHAKEYLYTAYTMRRLHVQELTFENDFPVIAEPQPTDTVFELTLNTMPLADRISGYSQMGVAEVKTAASPESEIEYLPYFIILGDVNSDGELTLLDVLHAMKLYVSSNPNAEAIKLADMNQNGKLEIADLLAIIKKIL